MEQTTSISTKKAHNGIRFIDLALFTLYISVIEDLFTFSLSLAGFATPLTDYISQVGFVLVFVLLIIDLLVERRKITPTFILVIASLFMFLITYRNFASFQGYIEQTYITFFTNAVLIFYIATNIKNYENFFEKMKPIIVFSLVYAVVVYTSSKLLGVYADMNIAYAILPATLASLVIAYREKRNLYYLYFGLFSILLFILGNRGTILILIIFILSYTMMHKGTFDIKTIAKPLILLGVLLLFTFIVVSNLNMIENFRLFAILSDKSFFQDNIRLKLWTDGIRFAIENPLSINGALSDRLFYFMKYAYTHDVGFYIDETMISGLYAHNLLIELIINLGIVIGGILSIYLIYNILKVLWIHRNRVEFILFIVSIGFIQLMYSSSYITSIWFWFMLGAIYSILKNESLKE